jgi:broad specificity phosphatase PhoE
MEKRFNESDRKSTERPAQLIFIRHAESTRNEVKRGTTYFADEDARRTVKGIPDYKIPLTEKGKAQAQQTGVCLRERFGVPDFIYHSGYLRTEQTLEEILKAFPKDEQAQIDIRMNQFIRERDPGYAYDMTTEEAETAFPWLREHWSTFGGYFTRPPGGESLSDASQRVYTFLNTLFRDRAGKRVWVVLHGGTLRVVRFLLERWDYEQALKWPEGQNPENCGITVYNYDEEKGRLVLLEYNTVCWK